MSLELGSQVRCLFGTGVLVAINPETKRCTVKLSNGTNKDLNISEIERSATLTTTQGKTVVTTTTTTATSSTTTTTTTKH
ncbi:hypothetical protein BASA81_011265 [Batrachochytrium salamandrivorans]|nr:hypothetical protein BASA81_011265 [Batrachochytrium salamandrivorans]